MARKAKEITVDDWLDELAQVVKHANDPGHTIREIAERAGMGMSTTRERVRKLVTEGKMVEGWATRSDTMGRHSEQRVYRIKK